MKFRDVFALMAACGLIGTLQQIAGYVVIRSKGDDIVSPEQFTPPFGLDIFFQGLHGAAYALLNFFSLFQIWYMVAFVVALAHLAKTSKGNALFAFTPAWLFPLFFRVVGAMFQK